MSQRDDILRALKRGERLTPLKALTKYGCLRLGARIWEIKRDGAKVITEMIEVSGGKRVAQYHMGKGKAA